MLGEHRAGAQGLVEHRRTVGRGIVLRERRAAAGSAMVLRELRDAVEFVDAGLGALAGGGADVGGVEQRALLEAFLAEQDGQRVQLLAVGAARHPDLQRGIGAQVRHDLLAQRPVIVGIAEHLAHLDGEEADQLRQHRRIVQHAILERRQGGAAELFLGVAQAAADRVGGVAAEVVVIAAVQRLEQKRHLDVVGRLHGGTPSAASRRAPARAACRRPGAWRDSRWRPPPGILPGRPASPWRSA